MGLTVKCVFSGHSSILSLHVAAGLKTMHLLYSLILCLTDSCLSPYMWTTYVKEGNHFYILHAY